VETGKVIESLLTIKPEETDETAVLCIICSSTIASVLGRMFPRAVIISNCGCQVTPNLASIYYAVQKFNIGVVSVVGDSNFDVESLVNLNFHPAEVELSSLSKLYEENVELVSSMYGESGSTYRAAFNEINVDTQVENILSVPEFSNLVASSGLTVCGFAFDSNGCYGEGRELYLINLKGVKDPSDIKTLKELESVSEMVKKRKVKRVHIQI